MTIALKLRRGTTAENDAFTGQEGELSYDTEAKQLRVHDGATPGGTKVAKDAVMTGATASAAGAAGLVPAPAKGAATRYLRSDGTWQVPPNTTYKNMTGATASAAGTAGLVPAPAAGKQDQFLRGDGSWGAISASASGVPSGTIIAYAGRTVPSGYLICNGAAVSRTTYANLFAAIGTIYGAGDGSTTFNLPNLAGRFLEGTTDSSSVGTYVEAGLPDITGTLRYDKNGYASVIEQSGALFFALPGRVGQKVRAAHPETVPMRRSDLTPIEIHQSTESPKLCSQMHFTS